MLKVVEVVLKVLWVCAKGGDETSVFVNRSAAIFTPLPQPSVQLRISPIYSVLTENCPTRANTSPMSRQTLGFCQIFL